MKLAISMPDDLFILAEKAADRLGVARSRLISMALEDFLKKSAEGSITLKLNEIYEKVDGALDPTLSKIQSLSLAGSPTDETW
jgi:metal-responsive CopG/Arc/MetJ family transcriptional regulator